MFYKWQLTLACYLIKFLYWIFNTQTPTKQSKPGQCVLNVMIHHNIPKNIKTTRDVIQYCVTNNKSIFWGILNNQFHIDYKWFDGLCQQNVLCVAWLLQDYGEAQTSLYFPKEDIKFCLETKSWYKHDDERVNIEYKKKINSNNLSEIVTTCPFHISNEFSWIEAKEKIKITKNIAFTSSKNAMIELQRIWKAPMFRSFFGILRTTDEDDLILYSNDFISSHAMIKRKPNFLDLPIIKLRSAAIMCNNDEEKKTIIDKTIEMFDISLGILVITKFNFEPKSNVHFLQREDLSTVGLLPNIHIIIIDDGAEFNLRSKYAEILFQYECKYKLVLYDQDNISNYLRLCGIVELKQLVPQIGNFAFIENNIIRVAPITSIEVLSIVICQLDPNLPPIDNTGMILFEQVCCF